MKAMLRLILLAILPAALFAQDAAPLRKEHDSLIKRGLWREAVTHYQQKLMPISDNQSGQDLEKSINALGRLNAWSEFDSLVETSITNQPQNPHLLLSAATAYANAPHAGRIIAGEFSRDARARFGRTWFDPNDPNATASAGESITTDFRDRVRSLQLHRAALATAQDDPTRVIIWNHLANALKNTDAWKLQTLTPLDTLPEWSEPGPEGGTEGAPWTPTGPLLYEVPASWEAAKNDGERWRFSLAEQARLDPSKQPSITLELARFSQSQFGTETLSSFSWWQNRDPESAKGILEIDTLANDESLAKTSDGIRRFTLPAAHHFIALYQSILTDKSVGASAGDALTEVFLNRRQYDKARENLETTIKLHGPGDNNSRKDLLQQITGNWGRFETATHVPSGTKPQIPLIFRNASKVTLTASPIDLDALLKDCTDHLKSNPRELTWDRLQLDYFANRLIQQNHSKFIGKPAATWEMPLTPREKHRDTRTNAEVPLDKAGAWWITAKMDNGNEFHTVVWIVDSVLVRRDVGGNIQWWVADATTGAPIPNTEISFFGYRTEHLEPKVPLARRMNVHVKEFKRTTDADGRILIKPADADPQFQWTAIARPKGMAPAFHGFSHLSPQEPQLQNANRSITYGISDRPLYKPGDTIHLKFMLRETGYFEPNETKYALQNGTLTLFNGRGEEALKIENLTTDDLGTIETSAIIPKDAPLGTWRAAYQIENIISAHLTFQVEEFRKPEYEVTVEAPAEPVKLGDSFTATVKATYFHGAPVRNATVEVTVTRESLTERWFPAYRWDWLYGKGAWWIGSQATWHPTWNRWGCIPPNPPWWQGDRWTPEEIVLEQTLPIGPDGTAKITIDTALAKQIHGDMDAQYSIEARVTDASRREENGTGTVIAARKPFEVAVWTNRGHAHSGDAIEATLAASTLAGKPVTKATGSFILYQISRGDGGKIQEKEIQRWPVETDADGKATQAFPAPATGQYRLAATLTFNNGEPVEGATLLNVHSKGKSDPANWTFGPLELIPDKTEYSPTESVKLRVNSDRENAHVWLFLHIAGAAGREAKRIQLDGKSSEIEIPLDLRDMPNMFLEGITVHGAQVHTAIRQILLPPVSKAIEVTLEPAKNRVKPRETSSLRITLRDADGKPIQGTAILAIYDKSLEAITGGSNVAPIVENFWNWKNFYQPHTLGDSLPHAVGTLTRPKATPMQPLGRFGDDALMESEGVASGGAGGAVFARGAMLSMDAAPAAMAAPMMEKSAPGEPPAGAGANNPILVRKDFADLLKWSGAITTNADGTADVPIEFPDNLTTWKARVWTLASGTRVGEGSAEIITSKELLVRLQAPRFLVERDEALLTAVVHNDHDTPKTVNVSIELDGDTLQPIDVAPRTIEIAARSEARVDWKVKAAREGNATFRMKADSGDDGDAVERTLPVLVHGMLRQDAWSRVIAPEKNESIIEIDVPEQRRPEQSKLTVRFSPTIAGAVVDAIPYLAAYPHGCTEQTLNRFVPAVTAQKLLKDMGINLAEVKAKRTNLNPQELGDSATRAAQWKQWQENPVFDELELSNMVDAGIEKLRAMQNADGGWGWFSGFRENSYPHTTAVVVHGLITAKNNGANVPDDLIQKGIAWLAASEKKETEALQRWVDHEALRAAKRKVPNNNLPKKRHADSLDALVRLVLGMAARDSEPMLAFLHRDRTTLPVYALCLLGLEHHRKEDAARRDETMKMISQFLKRDDENQTAYLDLGNTGYWWFWYGSEVEAHAWYLKLLAAVKPNDADTRGLVKYLVNNRKHATYWDSTRDTAFAIDAIATWFKASGEDAPEMEVEVLIGGQSKRKITINRENLFSFDGTVTLTGNDVTTGKHQITIKRTGNGSVYANAYLEVFTLEDKLRAAGLEVKVSRRITKLIPLDHETEVPDSTGLIVKQQVERFRREPLDDGATVKSGDRIEVELILESKNDYEYLLFSDAKAAGFEALDALSGYISGSTLSAYMEPRDQSVDFFIRSLPRGTHTLRYQLRAETPGTFKALPATAEAMYAPELRANSADHLLNITQP
jgi:uncharacterized protein YfaS (alpha-2-macroglobulin family)